MALWDTISAALLLTALISDLPDSQALTLGQLQDLAGPSRTESPRQLAPIPLPGL